jgi:hypothetical protein
MASSLEGEFDASDENFYWMQAYFRDRKTGEEKTRHVHLHTQDDFYGLATLQDQE